METQSENSTAESKRKFRTIVIFVVLATGVVYYLSNPKPQFYYDYTFRVAGNLLHGKVGFDRKPPAWLNEMIAYEGQYYSAFPFGSVVSLMPFAALKYAGVIKDMPAALIAGGLASVICLFLFLISGSYDQTPEKRILSAAGIMFGTWLWTNLVMGGAWQLTLGFAMVGELGAIYYTVCRRNPVLAGVFFALAFGNRTEIILTAPMFVFLMLKTNDGQPETGKGRDAENGSDVQTIANGKSQMANRKWQIANGKSQMANGKSLAAFCLVPLLLGLSTLVYNYVRFHSPLDFGHSHIPGVLDEPWYRYGIFSLYYIPYNFKEMLLIPWKSVEGFPYFTPTGFGGSILMASPFLLLSLRRGAKNPVLKYTAWAAIALMTFLLWIHGNAGGWQFSYRYAIILLPWLFLILLENGPKKITAVEWIAYILSFAVNLYATYLFLWTDYVKP